MLMPSFDGVLQPERLVVDDSLSGPLEYCAASKLPTSIIIMRTVSTFFHAPVLVSSLCVSVQHVKWGGCRDFSSMEWVVVNTAVHSNPSISIRERMVQRWLYLYLDLSSLIGGRGNPNVAVLVGNRDESKALSHKISDTFNSLNSVNTVLTLNHPSMKKK